jgi:hypothetical protein
MTAFGETTLSSVAHLSERDAAEFFKMGTSWFKKLCRDAGVTKWPYRKLRALEKLHDDLHVFLAMSTSSQNQVDCDQLRARIGELQAYRLQFRADNFMMCHREKGDWPENILAIRTFVYKRRHKRSGELIKNEEQQELESRKTLVELMKQREKERETGQISQTEHEVKIRDEKNSELWFLSAFCLDDIMQDA